MRIYKRKSNLPKPSIEEMVEMVELGKSGQSIQSVIQEFESAGINRSTLCNYVGKNSDQDELQSIQLLKGRPPVKSLSWYFSADDKLFVYFFLDI
jgi:hypothetical protein